MTLEKAIVMQTITALVLIALASLFAGGCYDIDDEPFGISEELPEETDDTPRYWMIVESASIPAWRVETHGYLPDPWAAVYRLGDLAGTTASCDMETYKPVWEDHVTARTVVEYTGGDAWSVVVYDYELEPSGNNWLGSCVVDATPGEIEHNLTVHLKDCQGAVESIVIRFEAYVGEIDTFAERNPNC